MSVEIHAAWIQGGLVLAGVLIAEWLYRRREQWRRVDDALFGVFAVTMGMREAFIAFAKQVRETDIEIVPPSLRMQVVELFSLLAVARGPWRTPRGRAARIRDEADRLMQSVITVMERIGLGVATDEEIDLAIEPVALLRAGFPEWTAQAER